MGSKRHLIRSYRGGIPRSACGLSRPNLYTHDPAEVTCLACRKSVFMADLEIQQAVPRRFGHRTVRKEQP